LAGIEISVALPANLHTPGHTLPGNHSSQPELSGKKEPMMTDVACFCGCLYLDGFSAGGA
jgi:hypothetical protein